MRSSFPFITCITSISNFPITFISQRCPQINKIGITNEKERLNLIGAVLEYFCLENIPQSARTCLVVRWRRQLQTVLRSKVTDHRLQTRFAYQFNKSLQLTYRHGRHVFIRFDSVLFPAISSRSSCQIKGKLRLRNSFTFIQEIVYLKILKKAQLKHCRVIKQITKTFKIKVEVPERAI